MVWYNILLFVGEENFLKEGSSSAFFFGHNVRTNPDGKFLVSLFSKSAEPTGNNAHT